MTVKRYLADPQTLLGTVTVTAITDDEKPFLRLAETWFHPQGGGQKADRGTIGTANVMHVGHAEGGEVDHFVDSVAALKVGEIYPFQIDAAARRVNMAYHTAGHLVGSALEARFPALCAVQGHQWPGEARVEFEGEAEDFAALQQALEDEIRKNFENATPVKIVGDPFANRAIQIGTYAPIPCGGTHVSAVGEIGTIKIDAIRKKGPRIRVSYSLEKP